jgi:hypothetical protein
MGRDGTVRRCLTLLSAGLLAVTAAMTATAQTPAQREASLEAFGRITEVLRHPRCLNCHPSGDSPRQADDRHRHRMLVARGPDDRGTPALKCSTCHQTENTADGRVPGAPHWQLAPRSMGWEGLSDADLCRVLKDSRKNKGRSVQALVEHMTTDALVQWAWSPGARTPPSIGQREFHELVRRWAQTGAACPG